MNENTFEEVGNLCPLSWSGQPHFSVLRSPPWHGGPLWNICVSNDHGYVPLVVKTSRSFPHSGLVTEFVTRLTRQVPLVEQELPTLPEHLISPPVFNGVRITRSLVLCVCFGDRCLSFCTFSFGHCAVCSSSIYGFWLPLLVSSNSSLNLDLKYFSWFVKHMNTI